MLLHTNNKHPVNKLKAAGFYVQFGQKSHILGSGNKWTNDIHLGKWMSEKL